MVPVLFCKKKSKLFMIKQAVCCKKYSIDEKNLKEIFTVWDNCEEEHPCIVKCPVKSMDSRSYMINVKDRDRFGKREYYNELKIPKKDINRNFCHKAASTYELAFPFLLLLERKQILDKLKETKNLKLFRLFVEAIDNDLLLGLEMLAREFKMDIYSGLMMIQN